MTCVFAVFVSSCGKVFSFGSTGQLGHGGTENIPSVSGEKGRREGGRREEGGRGGREGEREGGRGEREGGRGEREGGRGDRERGRERASEGLEGGKKRRWKERYSDFRFTICFYSS